MIRNLLIRYRPVIALALVAAVAEAAYAIINVLALPVFVDEELHATPYLGIIGGTFLAVEALMKGPMGAFSDRFGRRVLIVGGPIIAAATALLITVVTPPVGPGKLGLLVLIRAIDGLAAAAIWPTMFATMADQVEESRRTSAMSTLTLSYMAGVAVGTYAGGHAHDYFASSRAPFYLVSGLFVLTSVMAFFLIPRRPPHHHETVHVGEAGTAHWRDMVGALAVAPMMLLMAFIVFFAIGLLYPIASLYAMKKFGLTKAQFGELFLVPAVLIGVLALAMGRLGDHWGRARSVHLGLGIAAASMWALVVLPKTQWLLILGATFLGLGFVIGVPAWLATVSDVAGERWRGTVIGAVATTEGLGCFVGYLISPVLFEQKLPLVPDHELPVILGALAMTGGFLLGLATIRPTPQKRDEPSAVLAGSAVVPEERPSAGT